MGQTTSVHGGSPGGPTHYQNPTLVLNENRSTNCNNQLSDDVFMDQEQDYSSEIPDECLALIFQCLSYGDRKRCSVVCRRWLTVEGQTRRRLALTATSDISAHLPAIFTRFDSITKLALRCDRKSISINDEDLTLISLRCRNLTRLKLRGCREISDFGMSALAQNCKSLRIFSCTTCSFGAKGMNALLNNCSSLEQLSVKRLRGIDDGFAAEPIGPGAAASSLKSITLKELYNGQCFGPLVVGAENLKTLKILRCLGDWDRLLETITMTNSYLSEVHLERLQVSDMGLMAISKCQELETLCLVKAPDCSDDGISAIAEKCKLLRKLHIDGWRTNRIGDEGLITVSNNCVNLVELALIGVNPSSLSLNAIASKCKKLERLALCGSETIGDVEISCIAAKCMALKKLCIKCCRVTNYGVEAFAFGCPNLVKMKVKKCKGVTKEVAGLLRAKREFLAVSLDVDEIEGKANKDVGDRDDGAVLPPMISGGEDVGDYVDDAPSTSNRAELLLNKSRLSAFIASALQRLNGGLKEGL